MEFDLARLRKESADSLDIIFDDAFSEVMGDGSSEELMGLVRETCIYFHIQGVAALLLDGTPQHFFYPLGCAAENWRRLLLHLRGRGAALPPASDNVPLLGAVAARYWELARGICRVAASQRAGDEYEDEFAWAHLLQEFIALPEGRAFSPQLLQRYERVLTEAQPARLEVFQALVAEDRSRFVSAFEKLLQQHAQETEALTLSTGISPDDFAAYRFIWFEGLALLRLAERRGIKLAEPLLYCPPLARVPMKRAYDGDWALPFGAMPDSPR